jgi:hypothetical protein
VRKIMMLAAMVAALGIAPQPAEARDFGFGFRHGSPQVGAKLHRPHHGATVHHRGITAKPRHFKPRRFDRGGLVLRFGDRRGAIAKFAPAPRVKRRHFGHVDRGGFLLRFGDRVGIVAQFGPVPRLKPHPIPRLKPRHFVFRHGPREPFPDFGHAHRSEPRRFDPGHLRSFGHSFPGSEEGRHAGVHGTAPPEALLKQLEAQGFRYVTELLRQSGR